MNLKDTPDYLLQETLDAYEAHGSQRATAKALGVAQTTISRRLKLARHRFDYGIPEGEVLKGVSRYESYTDNRGKEAKRWIKTDVSKEKAQEIAQEVLDGMLDKIVPVRAVKPPKHSLDDQLAEYILTDYHLGMLAHVQESGAEWNLDISEAMVTAWLLEAMNCIPNAHTAIFVQLGDFQHFSSMIAETPASKHPLDAAARPYLIVRAAVRIMRRCIATLLSKHEHVHIKICDANHDPYGQLMLREMLRPLYENEPRVSIDDTPGTYYCYEWGDVSLFYHHGHKKNLKQVSEVFVGTFRDLYGRTKFSYGKIGHFHHGASTTDCLMKTEIMPALAPNDAHAATAGYLSKREAVTVVYHKKYGEIKRITTSPEMLK